MQVVSKVQRQEVFPLCRQSQYLIALSLYNLESMSDTDFLISIRILSILEKKRLFSVYPTVRLLIVYILNEKFQET